MPDVAELLESARSGNTGALARLLSIAEARSQDAGEIEEAIVGDAASYSVGVTGPPGAGKSTLIDAMITSRSLDERVAVLAVDPSSAQSGGALLADRIRMQRHATDPNVFIRSIASRGRVGGLALSVPPMIRLLGACGWPTTIVETVGTGQAELDAATFCDIVIVVTTPDYGDEIQIEKSGVLDVADVLVVNKSDKPGAEQVYRGLQERSSAPVVSTIASTGDGVDELWEAARTCLRTLESGDQLSTRRARHFRREVEERVLELERGAIRPLVEEIAPGSSVPVTVDSVVRQLRNSVRE